MYNIVEPEAEKDVFTDSSEGSDEIIDLSSLSESEPEEEESVQSTKEEPSQVPVNDDLKVMGLKSKRILQFCLVTLQLIRPEILVY